MRKTTPIGLAVLAIAAGVALLALPGAGDDEPLAAKDWLRNDLPAALAQAQKTGRPVLVVFR